MLIKTELTTLGKDRNKDSRMTGLCSISMAKAQDHVCNLYATIQGSCEQFPQISIRDLRRPHRPMPFIAEMFSAFSANYEVF